MSNIVLSSRLKATAPARGWRGMRRQLRRQVLSAVCSLTRSHGRHPNQLD